MALLPLLGRVRTHEVNKALAELELVSGDGALATAGQSHFCLGLLAPGLNGHVPHVGGEADQVVVLVDVVHDLDLEEGLGSVVHDLIGQLRLGNVLSQLLDTITTGLGSAIFVDDLVTLVLSTHAVLKLGDEIKNNGEFASEEGILAGVHCVFVHLEEVKVDSRNGLHEALEGSIDLELFEEAGNDTASGGPRETNLVIDNDRGVDASSNKGLADDVEVSLQGRGRVADRNPHVKQLGVVGFEPLHGLRKADKLLDLQFLLVDVDILELATVFLDSSVDNLLNS